MELRSKCCNICGRPHMTENCSVLQNVEVIRDTFTLSKARLSLPGGLEVLDLADGSTSVIARNQFNRGVQFGPVVARTVSDHDVFNDFPFPMKIFSEDEVDNPEWEYLDTANEDLCNWMCLVGAATCLEEWNLICFQMQKEVYFLVMKDVQPGDQLRVWYAPHYGIQMSAKELESSLANDDYFFIDDEEPLVPSSDAHPLCLSPQSNKKKKKKLADSSKSIVMPHSVSLSELRKKLASKLPSTFLGAKDPKCEWICSKCGIKSKLLLEYAEHLMTHHKVSLPYKCSSCQKILKTRKALKKHKEECKNKIESRIESVETSGMNTLPSNELDNTSIARNDAHTDYEKIIKIESRIESVETPGMNTLPANELDNTSLARNDAHITDYEKRQIDHSDISNVLDSLTENTTMKKSLDADSSRLLQCSGKESSFHKEYDSFLDSLADFRSNTNSLNIIGENNYSSKNPLKNDSNNVDSFTSVEIQQRDIIGNDILSVSAQSLRPKEIESDNPPILGLGDEIVFQNIKSFTDIENVVDKNTNHSDKISLACHHIDQGHLQNIAPDKSTDELTETDQTLDPNDFLVLLYDQTLDVTDADKDRLVDNLIKDTEDRLNVNVSDINCDAELIKVMLNDGAFSTPDLGKSANDDPLTEINLPLINNTLSASNLTKKRQEGRFDPEKCRGNNNAITKINPTHSSSNLTLIKQEHISVMTNALENVDPGVEVIATQNKAISDSSNILIDPTKTSEKDSLITRVVKVNENSSVTSNMISQESSSDLGTNRENNPLEEIDLKLNLDTSAEQIITDKNQENPDNNKSYTCEICNKTFSEQYYLYRHLKSHTGEFTCVQCLRVFARKKTLETHTCSNMPVFHCRLCNLVFKTKNDLKKHMLQHRSKHKSNNESWSKLMVKMRRGRDHISSNSMNSNEINNEVDSLESYSNRNSPELSFQNASFREGYVCEICGPVFKSKRGLQYHRQTHHSGDKKFSCYLCDRKFHRKSVLVSHINSHLAIKTSCRICKKSISGSSLSVHMRQHTGQKQYKCDVCGKTFFQKCNLSKHKRTNHKGNEMLNNCQETTGESVQIQTPDLENNEKSAPRSGYNQPGLLLKHKRKSQNSEVTIDKYICRYCHTILRSRNSMKRHLRIKHQDCEQEWSIPEIVSSMRVTVEETDAASVTVYNQSHQELITADTVENSTITIQPSTTDTDKTISNPISNQLCQLDNELTLKTENNKETDVIGIRHSIKPVSVAEFLQLSGLNENTPAYILGDSSVVQPAVQLDKDLFYLVLEPEPETII